MNYKDLIQELLNEFFVSYDYLPFKETFTSFSFKETTYFRSISKDSYSGEIFFEGSESYLVGCCEFCTDTQDISKELSEVLEALEDSVDGTEEMEDLYKLIKESLEEFEKNH